MQERVVDVDEWMKTVRELLELGKEVPVLVTGNSMFPFLVHKRDTVLVKQAGCPLRKGEIVFYQRPSGQYVMHRIIRIDDGKLYLAGDAQTVVEGPLPDHCVFGEIIAVERKGKWIRQGDFWWDFFAGPWLVLRPLRGYILAVRRKAAQIMQVIRGRKRRYTKNTEREQINGHIEKGGS